MLYIINKKSFGIDETLVRKHSEKDLEKNEDDDQYFYRHIRDQML
jgi:hypothetical protein